MGRCLQFVLNGGHDGGFGPGTGEGLGDLAVLEEEHGGDGHDAEQLGEGLLLVDVDLAHYQLVLVFGGNLVDDGADGLAGAAPGCPEVHQDRKFGFSDDGTEVVGGDGPLVQSNDVE